MKKNINKIIGSWRYIVIIFIIFTIIAPNFYSQTIGKKSPKTNSMESPDKILYIGKIIIVWSNGIPSFCFTEFYLDDLKEIVEICGDEVDIRVVLEIEMYFNGKLIFDREVDVTLFIRMDSPNGPIINSGMSPLDKYIQSTILSVDGEIDTYENETMMLCCEVFVNPYLVLFGWHADFPIPIFSRLPWPYFDSDICYIELTIVHEC